MLGGRSRVRPRARLTVRADAPAWSLDARGYGSMHSIIKAALLASCFAPLGGFGQTRNFAAVPILLAFAAAFVAYEALLLEFSSVAGGTDTFAAAIVGSILLNDGLRFAGLSALHVALTCAVPGWFGPTPTARLA